MTRTLLLLHLAVLVWAAGCAPSFKLSAVGERVTTFDGQQVWAYRAVPPDKKPRALGSGRAVVFYLPGSLTGADRQPPAWTAIEHLAGFAMMDMDLVLIERRGVGPDDRTSDIAVARRFSDKRTRVADALAVVRANLSAIPATKPIILIGASEGADVAAAVAAAEPRVTHLLLLGAGGGMSQADELKLLVSRNPGLFGGLTAEALDKAYADIRRSPDSEEMWLGQPYKRWSSFAWSPPLEDLLKVTIPIFLGQGDADTSVPVESARAVRDAFVAHGKTNLRYVEWADLDHSFRVVGSGKTGWPRIQIDVVTWLRDTGVITAADAEAFAERVHRAHTGWFGGVKVDGSVAGFDPATGEEVAGQPSNATSAPAGAAVAHAVAKGDMRRVNDFYSGPALDGIVVASPI